MLKEFPLGREVDRPAAEYAIESYREKLSAQQLALKEKKLPVIILIEGWGAAGKGSLIGRLIRYLDPRFYTVCTRSVPSDEELRKLLSGHLCRCTGYENILRAVKRTMYQRLGKPMPES